MGVMVQEADRFTVTGTSLTPAVELPEGEEKGVVGELIRPEAKPILRGRKVKSR